jgi:hypothetical protein
MFSITTTTIIIIINTEHMEWHMTASPGVEEDNRKVLIHNGPMQSAQV